MHVNFRFFLLCVCCISMHPVVFFSMYLCCDFVVFNIHLFIGVDAFSMHVFSCLSLFKCTSF